MHTKESLKKQLAAMGLTGEETILIHSSMKAIGETQKGADTVLDALMEFFEKGLLLLPTHTWKTINAENPVFDVDNEPACVGILPNLFLKRPGVIRSLHPTHIKETTRTTPPTQTMITADGRTEAPAEAEPPVQAQTGRTATPWA